MNQDIPEYIPVSSIRVNPGQSCNAQLYTLSTISPDTKLFHLVEPLKLNFLLTSEKHQAILDSKLEKFYALVDWNNESTDKLTLICTDTKRDGRNWEKDVKDMVEQFLTTIEIIKVKTKDGFFDDIRRRVRSSEHIKLKNVEITEVPDSNEFVVVGEKEDAMTVRDEINDIETKIDQEANSRCKLKLKHHEFMLCQSVINKIRQDGDLELNLNEQTNEVTLSGCESRISEAVTILKDEICNIEEVSIKNFLPETNQLLKEDKAMTIIKEKMQANNIEAFWKISDANCLIVLAVSKEKAVQAANIIKTTVAETKFSLNGNENPTLPFSEWTKTFTNLEQRMEGLIKIIFLPDKDELTVIRILGVTDNVMEEVIAVLHGNLVHEVVDLYEPTIFKLLYRRYSDELRNVVDTLPQSVLMMNSKLSALKMRGTQNDIKLIRHKVVEIVENLKKKTCFLRRSESFPLSTKNLSKLEERTGCAIRMLDSDKSQEIHMQLTAFEGDVSALDVDVIVISVDTELQPTSQLLKTGTKKDMKMVKYCDNNIPNRGRRNEGDVYMSTGGNLNCLNVIHAVGPGTEKKVLEKTVLGCLNEIDRGKFRSLAFPDTFFTSENISKLFLKILSENILQKMHMSIKELVFYGEQKRLRLLLKVMKEIKWDRNIKVECFLNARHTRPYTFVAGFGWQDSPPFIPEEGFSQFVGGTKILVSEGDITNIQVDAIVNSSNKKLDLTKGFVSRNILFKVGHKLERELQSEQSKKDMSRNGITVTSSGDPSKIPCLFIFHVDIRTVFGNPTDKLRTIILDVLKKAEGLKLTSIAFPALGTGSMNLKLEDTVNCMCKAIETFNKKTISYLKDIHMLIFNGQDLPILHEAFRRYFINHSLKWNPTTELTPCLPTDIYGISDTEIDSAVQLLDRTNDMSD